jgi:hypothetical protein
MLRSLSYGTVGPASRKMTRDLRGLQFNHAAYIDRKLLPDTKYKVFSTVNAGLNADFDDVREIQKTYKDVLNYKDQKIWWNSMRMKFHAMETNDAWDIL